MCPHNTVRVSFYYCILLEFSGVSAPTNESEISRSEKIHLEKLIKKAEKADERRVSTGCAGMSDVVQLCD